MNNLTAHEISEINNINTNTKDARLGDVIQQLIDIANETTGDGTPVNAVNASAVLTIARVALDGETITINNPLVTGTDVYELLADAAQSKSAPGNIAVNINASAVKSAGSLALPTQPISGDKMTIGTKEYTFVPVGTATADGEISIGADLAAARLNIVAAINGTDEFNEAHPLVSAAAFVGANCAITALVGGVAGDLIATTETFDAVGNVFAAVTLGAGGDCSGANAITALVAAIAANDTQGVGAADGNGDTLVLTADIAGVSGNDIIIGETMSDASFANAAVLLAGGVNGTVGVKNQSMMDASYLYRCIAANTITGKNWRRISLGSAY